MSTATESGSGTVPGESSARVSRRLYLPTVAMAGVTAWLSWRGWTALEGFGPARSIGAGRYQLIGPVVIGLHLWDIAYRHVKTLDVLFLVQVAACLVAAIDVLALRRLIVVLGAAALVAGTIVGFILARTVGIFGFHLTFSSGLAYTVLVIEAVAVIMLGITALLMPGPARSAA